MFKNSWCTYAVCVAIVFSSLHADVIHAGLASHDDAATDSFALDDSIRLSKRSRKAHAKRREAVALDNSRESMLTLVILGDFKHTVEAMDRDHVDESMEQLKSCLIKLSALAQTCTALERNCGRLRALLISPLSHASAISPAPTNSCVTAVCCRCIAGSALATGWFAILGPALGFLICDLGTSSDAENCAPWLYVAVGAFPLIPAGICVLAASPGWARKFTSWRTRASERDPEQWRQQLNAWLNTDIEQRLSRREIDFRDIMTAVNDANPAQLVEILETACPVIMNSIHEMREFKSIPFCDE